MKKSHLSRDEKGRHVPGYPGKVGEGSSSPEGYQKESRGHSPSSAGTKLPVPKRGKM